MSESKASMGFISWLTLLFIGLKLTGYIAWSWWWVLSPLWLPLVLVFFGALIFIGIVEIVDRWKS